VFTCLRLDFLDLSEQNRRGINLWQSRIPKQDSFLKASNEAFRQESACDIPQEDKEFRVFWRPVHSEVLQHSEVNLKAEPAAAAVPRDPRLLSGFPAVNSPWVQSDGGSALAQSHRPKTEVQYAWHEVSLCKQRHNDQRAENASDL
jgi:hypothetical protein